MSFRELASASLFVTSHFHLQKLLELSLGPSFGAQSTSADCVEADFEKEASPIRKRVSCIEPRCFRCIVLAYFTHLER